MDKNFHLPPDWRMRVVSKALAETQDWSLAFLGVDKAWVQSKGKNTVVAVLDTGVDDTHPDLQGAIRNMKDFTGSRFGTKDLVSHGTWCAGMIGARENGSGSVGIAPLCELLCGKVLDDSGSGAEQWIQAGITWADAQGADIISMSLGGGMMSPSVRAVITQFIAKGGKFLFAAAGNEGHLGGQDTVGYPAKWPETIAVAAVDQLGNMTSFSSNGPEVAIAAPGYNMVSTIPMNKGGYGQMSGTSMATPVCAAVGALCVSKHKAIGSTTPLYTTPEMKEHLKKTAVMIGDTPVISPVGLLDLDQSAVVNPTPGLSQLLGQALKLIPGIKVSIPAVLGDTFSVK